MFQEEHRGNGGNMPAGCCGFLNSKMLSDVNLEICAKFHTSANKAFSEQASCCG